MIEIKSFEKIMNKPREGWPTLADIKRKSVFMDDKLIGKVDNLIRKYRRCLIRGAEGRGKTVLARILGFNRYKTKWKIRFIDIREGIIESDIDRTCNYIKEIADKNFLFIVENVHSSLDKISKLIEIVDESHETSFIFTSRKIFPGDEQLVMLDPFEEWEEKGWCIDLKPNLGTAIGIIKKFISARKMDYSLTGKDESWVKTEFGEEAVNLRRLNWYLETWSEISGPLYSVKKNQVLEKILCYH